VGWRAAGKMSGKRGPSYSPGCHPGQRVRPFVSRGSGVALDPGNLGALILVRELGNHVLNASGLLLARPGPGLSCAGDCAG
jgi:hypothetical protein